MIQTAIFGAAGLTGQELIRLITHHPGAHLRVVTSDKYAGQPVGQVFAPLRHVDLGFVTHEEALAPEMLEQVDLAFLAVPNEAALELVPRLLAANVRVIDLSGAHRLQDREVFRRYYQLEGAEVDVLAQAVYGLPEAFGEQIAKAKLVANPGCYPTATLLGLLPLGDLALQLAAPPIVDAKSGVSGAGGRVEGEAFGYMGVNENFRAYKLFHHQHTPEMEAYFTQGTGYQPKTQGALVFTPHLLPLARGILATIHLRFNAPVSVGEMWTRYENFAVQQPFVRLLAEGEAAELRPVQQTNDCNLSLHHNEEGTQWVVLASIDNLLKGAAGQAVQNMNLMFGHDQTTGLV